jgi:hypothetical protein
MPLITHQALQSLKNQEVKLAANSYIKFKKNRGGILFLHRGLNIYSLKNSKTKYFFQ